MMALKILLIMEACGLGDHIAALPAISMLARQHEVTVIAREFYAGMFRDVGFIRAVGQDEQLKPRFDKNYWLAEWSVREEMMLGRLEDSRIAQFASLIDTELPAEFSWLPYLNPNKKERAPYIVLAGSSVEPLRSLPENIERELCDSLPLPVIRLPHVNVYRNNSQALNAENKFIAGILQELIDLIYNARAVIAVDGGPLRLAWAMNVPSVGIYGLSSPDKELAGYERYVPLRHEAIYGVGHSKCWMPCYRQAVNGYEICESRGTAHCMENVSIPDILKALETLC